MTSFRWLLAGLLLCSASLRGEEKSSPARIDVGRIDFDREIRPILSNVCFDCHGPDQGQRKGDLRLDTRESLFADRDGTKLVVPRKLEQSELYRRITSGDKEERMPPPNALRQLDPKQIELIKLWIEQGAEWKSHWAYAPVQVATIPDVKNGGEFVQNDIDRFVMEKLNALGMKPSPEADKVTLIRRLSFDLVGLPPTPKEVQEFVSDTRPDAYERLVDRLMTSPHFGERMAMFWLDLVRYADTNGYHGDNHEDRDLYRDWVIEAFNRNQPFDQFTVEQLAGDLLPQPSQQMQIASGYNRLLMTTREGGAQAKEYMAKYSADRVRNFSSVWLASTMGCCECHDHKYDPFTTRDFYTMAAFFADIQEVAVGVQAGTKMPTPDEKARLAAFDQQMAPLRKVMETQTPELEKAQAEWEESLRNRKVEWVQLKPTEAKSTGKSKFKIADDGTVTVSEGKPGGETYRLKYSIAMKGITALRLELLADDAFPGKGPGRAANGNLVLSEFTAALGDKPITWAEARSDHSQAGYDIAHAIDGKAETGWGILPQTGQAHQGVFELKAEVGSEKPETVLVSLVQNYGENHSIGKFRISATKAARPVPLDGGNGLPSKIAEILALDAGKRTAPQKQELSAYFRSVTPLLEKPRGELAGIQKQRDVLFETVRTTLISTSGPARMMRVLPRGNWLDDSGAEVGPAVPAFLTVSAKRSTTKPTRLDLAEWVVSPDNPLTARVFVNRLWKIAFGQGLVKTVEDFGAQGTPPTHPELLDWLASEFSGSKSGRWDVKKMLKLMVMSGTYRQSSFANEAMRQQDPHNQWLARQGRFRMDAEFVHDTALSVSGLLVDKVGGPSVKPYQPAGYWSYLNFPIRDWEQDKGAGLYRRGLYTYWCRTFLHPSFKAFDAPTREECTADRPRSNTPLQALVLMNDPIYVEAARAFAERILREGPADVKGRLEFAYRQILSRGPRPQEIILLTKLHAEQLAEYQKDPKGAEELLHVGVHAVPEKMDRAELAAWTAVARVLLNLHETITRN
ncbi:MAG: PSD1 and planctomycete cytochrome C domain-containing protein [Planctomycetales bacterium]